MADRIKFTKAQLEGLKLEDAPYVKVDTDVRGGGQLRVRVARARDGVGVLKTLSVHYRERQPDGSWKQRSKVLGDVAELRAPGDVEDIRAQARAIIRAAKTGVDITAPAPVEEPAKAVTVRGIADRYFENRCQTNRDGKPLTENTVASRRRDLDYIAEHLGADTPVADVTDADLEDLGVKVRTLGASTANKRLTTLRGLFKYAGAARVLERPSSAEFRRKNEEARKEVLDRKQLAAFMAGIDVYQQKSESYEWPYPSGMAPADPCDALRLLCLTGARRGEVLSMEWGELVDLDGEAPRWVKPAAKTKTRKEHPVPLSARAVAILKAIRERRDAEGGWVARESWVFPSERSECGHLKNLDAPFRKAVETAREIAPCEWWATLNVHDLRASFASIMLNDFHLPIPEVMRLTGHADVKSLQRYLRDIGDDGRRAAVDGLGSELGEVE